jgi:hypothetical protein
MPDHSKREPLVGNSGFGFGSVPPRYFTSQDPGRKTVPITCGGWEEEMPDARWRAGIKGAQGAHSGNYKHGRYTAEAIASRRWLKDQIPEVRALTQETAAALMTSLG